MGGYESFACVYDALMSDVDYASRTDYLCRLFDKFDKKPSLLLDLACGTGGYSNEFSSRGIQVIGVDISEEMLSIAKEKSAASNNDVLYLCQSAQELDLYGTVDAAVCCMDSLNHIIDYNDFSAAIAKVSLFLEPERLFIFDVNTEYKHKEILADNTFVFENKNIYCVWQNSFIEEENITDIYLDFFIEKDGVYSRSHEEFSERAYTADEIKSALKSAGLKIEAIYEDMSINSPSKETQRLVYVTRKLPFLK
ncbi:MAG: methyltransferase domain-containing protein [Clostridia bacterium]|nr:methyltransferase domain-containing protein [Clostridia bacterium]